MVGAWQARLLISRTGGEIIAGVLVRFVRHMQAVDIEDKSWS